MKESQFLRRNNEKWQQYERHFRQIDFTPDQLGRIFIELTDDLAYAQTHFPKSRTTYYLNQLTAEAHKYLYKNKKEKKNRFKEFWLYELPLLFLEVRRELVYAFLIFGFAVLLGVVSTAYDETFVRLILGDAYVNMTLANIDKDDPMAVYKQSHQVSMFLGITVNNIFVSFKAFAYGVAFSLGTALILIFNGIMLGAFQYFFFQQGVLIESMLVIWIHGTIEISSIVIAGAAGIVMGNSILFPKTYTRLESFKRGANKGLKMVIGIVPLFIIAGFLESFVTRLTEMPAFLKLFIILGSASFMVFYFWIYPAQLGKKRDMKNNFTLTKF
jgi:uncharacterized membrane protein SpoIIM required for sporulation